MNKKLFLYPSFLLGAYLLYFFSYKTFHSQWLSLYLSVSTPALIIFILESLYPFKKNWKPTQKEIISDLLAYTLGVQAIFPLTLYFIGVGLLKFTNTNQVSIWPKNLAVIFQLSILVICGEFFQYWWHRLAHTYKILWPIHAIHHFPKKLYSWNTSRFHPLDKFVEFFFTIFIFFAIGMPFEIFVYYYIFYAITGYFQHSNLDCPFGLLDYVFASGETHRLHHDSNYEQSKCNYANNLVIFDQIFGTFKRNPDASNLKVGIQNHLLPVSFNEELLFPFYEWAQLGFESLLKISMFFIKNTSLKELEKAAREPRQYQRELLKEIIAKNKKTLFGKEHQFINISSYENFRDNVPIRNFEEIRPYLNLVLEGKNQVLTHENPHYFAKTSGTTGLPKYIPITKSTQKRFIKTQQLIAYSIYQERPDFMSGNIYSIVGNEIEELLTNQIPCGSMSGKLYSLTSPLIRAKHIFQSEISQLNDSEKKYLYLAALALLSPEITFYASPNPSTLLKIFETINSKKNEIEDLLKDKNDKILNKFSQRTSHALALLKENDYLTVKKVWPKLKVVTLWMEGSCSYLIPKLKNSADSKVVFKELGYVASEFYGTIGEIPTLMDNFFEFIEVSDYHNKIWETKLIDEIQVGYEYYLIVTTTSGLYRYFINDIVKVTGKFLGTPTFSFSQKGKGITNITGEKISEKQLVNFFEKNPVDFFICLADQVTQSYQLYIENNNEELEDKIEEKLDQFLKECNIEFATKRKDGRLPPIKIYLLKKGAADQYKEHCLKNGQREAQFKFLHLQYLKDVSFDFPRLVK